MAPSANLKATNATRLARHFRKAAKSDPSFSARSCPDKGSPHQAPRPNRGGRRARRAVHAHWPGPRRTRGWRSADRKRLTGHRSRRGDRAAVPEIRAGRDRRGVARVVCSDEVASGWGKRWLGLCRVGVRFWPKAVMTAGGLVRLRLKPALDAKRA